MELMSVEEGRKDDGLAALSQRVDYGFARMEERFERIGEHFDAVEREIGHNYNEADHRFNRLEAIGAEIRAQASSHHEIETTRSDRLHHTLLVTSGGLIGTLIVTCGTVIGIAVA